MGGNCDLVAGVEGLTIAYGFSGQGFELAPVVGKALAQSLKALRLLGQTPVEPLEPYRPSRFAEGALLKGVYGIGAIS